MSRLLKNLIVVAAFALAWRAGVDSALSQAPSPQAVADQARAMAEADLDRYSTRIGAPRYTDFELSPSVAAPPQPGGFAPPLMPRGAAIVRRGVMEITPSRWSPSIFPDSTGGNMHGEVSLRLSAYRVFEAERGWSGPQLLSIHFWTWSVHADQSDVHIRPDFSKTGFVADNWVQELVASIYNVPPAGVIVRRPDPAYIERILSQNAPNASGKRFCRSCEVEQPDGTCRQVRACGVY